MVKKIIQRLLASAARDAIIAHAPEVIAVTGSVGKTSTRDAIACVLGSAFNIRTSRKNYNNEFGLPLTILDSESGGKSAKKWLEIIRAGRKLARDRRAPYPEMLVLEMGIDHPGDMDYLVSIARPTRAVLTRLGSSHAEFFPSIADLHKEKLKLAKALPDDGCFIYNAEDEALRAAADQSSVPAFGYGFSETADVQAQNIAFSFNSSSDRLEPGVSFKLVHDGASVPVFIPGIISRTSVLAALAGAAVGFSYGLNSIKISTALRDFMSPAGRMRLISGIRESIIIDDTYNASPESVTAALETIADISRDHYATSWALLGDMLELGNDTVEKHRQTGRDVAAKGIDRLVAVGKLGRHIGEGALEAGMESESVTFCTDSREAAHMIAAAVGERDLLFVKGSQGARMEHIVKALMARPEEASNLLVRQGSEWQA